VQFGADPGFKPGGGARGCQGILLSSKAYGILPYIARPAPSLARPPAINRKSREKVVLTEAQLPSPSTGKSEYPQFRHFPRRIRPLRNGAPAPGFASLNAGLIWPELSSGTGRGVNETLAGWCDELARPAAGGGGPADRTGDATRGALLRRLIMLICVDWLPTCHRCVAGLPRLYARRSSRRMPT
jgi:hypothetical protein